MNVRNLIKNRAISVNAYPKNYYINKTKIQITN